ncbi:MAG: hypothetical protein A3I75_06530 [Deltaproteobacteria bacterium RIFCSPLOWO2_02_FULL_50_16]|nr:MAG: hypothetical protein A3B79_00100 [Deltaproteobacteria bacterium RIFCSPHIGHO2_02_FULL_50_15]OGQ56576.1 MAG: hypothetical protein A3I75_06530 [Deltaproteobacteria bacterium RIFCSPLOWO2_02_FULL_50_16]
MKHPISIFILLLILASISCNRSPSSATPAVSDLAPPSPPPPLYQTIDLTKLQQALKNPYNEKIPIAERCLAQSSFVLPPQSLSLKKTSSGKNPSWQVASPFIIEFPDLTESSWQDERGPLCPQSSLIFTIPALSRHPLPLHFSIHSQISNTLNPSTIKTFLFPTDCPVLASFTLDTSPSPKSQMVKLKLTGFLCSGLRPQ